MTTRAPKAKKANQSINKSTASDRIQNVVALLHRYYPQAVCALDHKNPFELLVATILSAQCTDVRVNQVTPALFARFPTAERMAQASARELETLIKPTGFFRAKAKSLQSMSRDLHLLHGGHIPRTVEELTALRGVGRKTANVVLGVAFKQAEGVVVDTHVKRLSQRLGFTRSTNPVVIERDLMRLIPRARWIQISHELITHGRMICVARKPRCSICFLSELCPSRD